jgi:Tol biopolymer transport system component
MPRLRPLQIVMVTTLLAIGASTAQLGTPLLASPYATGREDKSELPRQLSAISTGAVMRTTEANMTGITTRVSVASDGTQGNGGSYDVPSISADGRYVAFGSDSDNLVPNDTNNQQDIFVHDRQTGETWRISVASDGSEANAYSGAGAEHSQYISADGRFITFVSSASNLVQNDTGNDDVFVHDRFTGQTTRVSIASDGTEGNRNSYAVSISGDGRFVAFASESTNLVPNDTNNWGDVFVHDRQTGATIRVSIASDSTEANSVSIAPEISADGRFVAFASRASNLDSNCGGWWTVFVHDLLSFQ